MNFRLAIVAITLSFAACNEIRNEKTELRKDIGRFAESYFNYDFKNAMQYCTPDSKKWLAYIASNISEADLVVLRDQEEGASVSIKDIEIHGNDSTGVVRMIVRNFMCVDTIGRSGRMKPEGIFVFNIVKREGRWLIRMGGLPRNEKSNHD